MSGFGGDAAKALDKLGATVNKLPMTKQSPETRMKT
jgi:hypothetical protein